MPARWIVVTDLDGTLLDAEDYSWEPARTSIATLRSRDVPIVFCTSKTRAETERLRDELAVHAPFIVEDGGAICWPDSVEVLGLQYPVILAHFKDLNARTGGALIGFSQMSDAELAQDCGLPIHRAALARQREFDEPFRFLRDEAVHGQTLQRFAAERGLKVTRGGRYFHLHGPSDKGDAVRRLLQQYRDARSIGLGDSALDLPMLQAVDVAVAVARPDGSHDETLVAKVPGLVRTTAPGPRGWSEAIREHVLDNPADPSSESRSAKT